MNFEDIQAMLESGGEYRPVTEGVESINLCDTHPGVPSAKSPKEENSGDARFQGVTKTVNIRISQQTHDKLGFLQFSLSTAEGVRETLDSIICRLIESGAPKAYSPDVLAIYNILLKNKKRL